MMDFENKKITKEEYRKELIKAINGMEKRTKMFDSFINSSKVLEHNLFYTEPNKIRMDYIEKLYNLDSSEE